MAVYKNGRLNNEVMPYFGELGRRIAGAENVDEMYNIYPTGRRNVVQNGAMLVNQRFEEYTGVTEYSGAGTGNDYKEGPDRWQLEFPSSTYQLTIRRGTSNPAPGFKFYYEVEQEVDFDDPDISDKYIWVVHKINGYDMQNFQYGTPYAKPSVIQFWVRSAHPGQYALNVYAAADPSGTRIVTRTYTIGAANRWEKKVLTIPPNYVSFCAGRQHNTAIWLQFGAINDDSRSQGQQHSGWTAFATDDYMTGGRSNALTNDGDTFAITGVQWEIGTMPTPYEHRSFAEELVDCQRYLYRVNSIGGASRIALSGNVSSSSAFPTIQLPVPMNTTPSVYVSSLSAMFTEYLSGGQQNPTGISINTRAQSHAHIVNNVTLLCTHGSGLSGPVNLLLRGTAGVDWFQLTCEL